MTSIILLGIKHCGKSTQGRLLSRHFGCDFFDTDDEITNLTGKTPREIYTQKGKEGFLNTEKSACKNLAEKILQKQTNGSMINKTNDLSCVIATGGGICNNPDALKILHGLGKFVFLNADEKTAITRIINEIKYDGVGLMKNLPAYISSKNPKNIQEVRLIFHDFYKERQKIYKDLCDIEIKLEHSATKQENLKKILKSLSLQSDNH